MNDNASVPRDTVGQSAAAPPTSLLVAMARGGRGRCPACGSAPLFPRFLKPTQLCPDCRQDWSHQRADDFPAYVAILLTGHIVVSSAVLLEHFADPPMWVHLALWLPLATLLLVGLLQPVKGAIIAIQWRYGMHGFEPGSRHAATKVAPNENGHDQKEES